MGGRSRTAEIAAAIGAILAAGLFAARPSLDRGVGTGAAERRAVAAALRSGRRIGTGRTMRTSTTSSCKVRGLSLCSIAICARLSIWNTPTVSPAQIMS
jgi:hypothetical protein